MARVTPVSYDAAPPESRCLWDRQVVAHGRMSNMMRTLARAPVALDTMMRWYQLSARVEPFLGPRTTTLLAYALSDQAHCHVSVAYFGRMLKDAGDDPDDLRMNEREALVDHFGRALVRGNGHLDDHLFAALARAFTEDQLVDLTAFAAVTIAMNVFCSALKVEIDPELEPQRAGNQGAQDAYISLN